MSELNLTPLYLAGFFDADGTVSILKSKRGGVVRHQLSTGITNCCAPVIAAIHAKYGGAFVRRTLPSTLSCGQRDTYGWHAMCRIAEGFLRVVLPFLIVKKAEVEIALAFQARMTAPKGRPLSVEEMEIRDALAEECSRLKHVRYDSNDLPASTYTHITPPPPKRWNKTRSHN